MVEAVISLARTVLSYHLSGMQSRLVVGGVGQPNITTKLATLVKHVIIKAGEATEKVLCKCELLPILTQSVCRMKGEEYSMDCIKFLHSKYTECASLMAKLEWCVGEIYREMDKAASQGATWSDMAVHSMAVRVRTILMILLTSVVTPFGTGEETDFDLTGRADPLASQF